MAGNYYFSELGWYPRTREVIVRANAPKWVTGELKLCLSSSTSSKSESASLMCDDVSEYHALNVTFWGTITTERDKIWKSKRGETSLTCKFQ